MKKLSLALILSGVATLALAGCGAPTLSKARIETRDAHYWQRTEASSAVYQRGPKAQQMLHRDIARCVTQVRELQHLGTIRSATPGDVDINGGAAKRGTPEGRMAAQDTPDHDGYLLSEQSDFHDFETCMQTEGWDRVEYLPYSIADDARQNYINTMTEQKRRTKSGKVEEEQEDAPATADYKELNQ